MSPTRSRRPAPAPHQPTTASDASQPWTEDRVRALGVVTDLPTAANVLGLGRALAYQLARDGQFPVPVLRAGHRYRVPVAAILAALHLSPASDATTDEARTAPPSADLITAPQSSVDHDDNIRRTGPHDTRAAPPSGAPSP